MTKLKNFLFEKREFIFIFPFLSLQKMKNITVKKVIVKIFIILHKNLFLILKVIKQKLLC